MNPFHNIRLPLGAEAPMAQEPERLTVANYYYSESSIDDGAEMLVQIRMKCTKLRGQRLPVNVVEMMREWIIAHIDHPYPSTQEKMRFCIDHVTYEQVCAWFRNARRRDRI